jgi:hypothetical protein
MSVCALCGQPALGEDFCSFHVAREPAGWAVTNRSMCDFVHRGIVPPKGRESEGDFDPILEPLDEALIA